VSEQAILGRYEIVSELGRGAMGVVYKATDPLLSRIVAIKTVNMAFDRDGIEEYAARFYLEAKAAGGLSHPNIVTIYDVGKSGALAYMSMEFIDGVELRSYLVNGQAMGLAHAVSIAAQVAEGLGYAHQRGVVHRDVKPANIMVPPTGPVKITDFGIARMRSSEALTQTGTMLGSPKYMSPEQALGKRADHRADLFALGIILYEMLTGAAPFTGESVAALMYQIVNVVPAAPSMVNPAVPEMLDLIVAKMLAKELDNRYQSALDAARDLRECEATLPHTVDPALPPDPATRAALGRLDPEASIIILSQTIERSRQADATGPASHEAAPARGVSRNFDSLEATQRIAVLGSILPGAVTQDTEPAVASTATLPRARARRSWGRRETALVAASALAGLIMAAVIVLA